MALAIDCRMATHDAPILGPTAPRHGNEPAPPLTVRSRDVQGRDTSIPTDVPYVTLVLLVLALAITALFAWKLYDAAIDPAEDGLELMQPRGQLTGVRL